MIQYSDLFEIYPPTFRTFTKFGACITKLTIVVIRAKSPPYKEPARNQVRFRDLVSITTDPTLNYLTF